jgi:hypothetical protein
VSIKQEGRYQSVFARHGVTIYAQSSCVVTNVI